MRPSLVVGGGVEAGPFGGLGPRGRVGVRWPFEALRFELAAGGLAPTRATLAGAAVDVSALAVELRAGGVRHRGALVVGAFTGARLGAARLAGVGFDDNAAGWGAHTDLLLGVSAAVDAPFGRVELEGTLVWALRPLRARAVDEAGAPVSAVGRPLAPSVQLLWAPRWP